MERVRRNVAVVVLVVWTLLVWSTRFGTIWSDDELTTAGKVGRTALALTFTLLALAVAAALWRSVVAADLRRPVGALAGWTTIVWIVRAVQIVAGDHDTGFKVVHVVLAVVSIGLSVLAVRSLRERDRQDQWEAAEPSATG
jgi:hypothetical protein